MLDQLPEAFRTGLGLDYDAHGPECAAGIARGFEPWMRTYLLPDVVPQLDGVEAGCGTASRSPTWGAAPAAWRCCSRRPSRRRAWSATTSPSTPSTWRGERQADAGHHQRRRSSTRATSRCPTTARVDFVTTFDCIHDMTDPPAVIGAIRAALDRRRHLAARRHQGARHLRRERRAQPDGER